ncbi:hypothetical protein [Butyrivibrio sp. JL13D10]
MGQKEWILNLEDNEWPLTTIDHLKNIYIHSDEGWCEDAEKTNR